MIQEAENLCARKGQLEMLNLVGHHSTNVVEEDVHLFQCVITSSSANQQTIKYQLYPSFSYNIVVMLKKKKKKNPTTKCLIQQNVT